MKERKYFYPTRDEEERAKDKSKVFTVRLNEAEIRQLKRDMKVLQQAKPSTALKQLADIGRYVLHRDKIGVILGIITGNKRRNERIGITEAEAEIDAKVT